MWVNAVPISSPTHFAACSSFPFRNHHHAPSSPPIMLLCPRTNPNILPLSRQSPNSSRPCSKSARTFGSAIESAVHCFLAVMLCFLQSCDHHAIAGTMPKHKKAVYDCEIVSQYYNAVHDLKGDQLKKKLYSIIRSHHALTYAQVWDALKFLDAADSSNPEVSSDIIEIYTQRAVSKTLAAKPEGWNREHLWPRSYGLIHGHPEFTDLHNLRPADVNVNSARGNKYYGECTQDRSKRCLVPATNEAAPDTATTKESWTPPSKVRGDIARALFYMAVRYGINDVDGGIKLQLSDTPKAGSAQMGLLSVLLRWNIIDPPSREERLRNFRVCTSYQHNRNPFVDHPEYAELIWRRPTLLKFEENKGESRKGESGRNGWINKLLMKAKEFIR